MTPDAQGATIEIRNIALRTYYVYRPSGGRRMVLPTQGWTPPPVSRRALGAKVAERLFEVYERRTPPTAPEQRVPALNFLTVLETRPDGRRRTLTDIQLGEPVALLFAPPPGALVTVSRIRGGIVALPSSRRSEKQ